MKPWLLNIMACPMCKSHPLDAYFFKWENSEDDLRILAEQSGKPSSAFSKSYHHTVNQVFDGTITLEAMARVKDETLNPDAKELMVRGLHGLDEITRSKDPISSAEKVLATLLPEVDALYRYLNLIDVEEGLLHCNKCSRWYPIGSSVPAIPEMLPDELREKQKDLGFLKKWENRTPSEVTTKGKPFNLKEQ